MKRKLIAVLTAVTMLSAAMSSSVFAAQETETAIESQIKTTSSQTSAGAVGNISTEEVDLEQQRIILQRQREFEANLAASIAAEVRTEVSIGDGPPDFDTAIAAADLNDDIFRLKNCYQTVRCGDIGRQYSCIG